MSRQIFRYEVPVDDREHRIKIGSDPLAVGCTSPERVEFWAIDDLGAMVERAFTVVGTGHPLPPTYVKHWGAAVVPIGRGRVVWHLVEVES